MEFRTNLSDKINASMKKLIFLLPFILLFACKQNEIKPLLQGQEVQLVKPRIKASNQLIDSTITISAELRIADIKILFTSNGEEPSENSKLYKQPLLISEPGIFKFKAFHTSLKESETETIEIIKKGHTVTSILWTTQSSKKYSGMGERTLINNTKATVSYTNSEWVGFDTIAKATVFFKEKTFIKSVDIGYLNNPGSWIFPPQQITTYISTDGITFIKKKVLNIDPLDKTTDQKIEKIKLLIDEEIQAIKIEVKNVQEIPSWHDGSGKSAWLFMDEWIFN